MTAHHDFVMMSSPHIAADILQHARSYGCIVSQVLRYWPKDAGRNKGDPWFAAVVTDYEEDTGEKFT
jgi:hypothetical protein